VTPATTVENIKIASNKSPPMVNGFNVCVLGRLAVATGHFILAVPNNLPIVRNAVFQILGTESRA